MIENFPSITLLGAKKIMRKRYVLSSILMLLFLCPALQASANDDLKLAEDEMIKFFSYLSTGNYEQASLLYQPYDPKTDIPLELKKNCSELFSHSICLPILKVVSGRATSGNAFLFTVQFKNSEGKKYRGFDPEKGEYLITDFEIRVMRVGSEYKIINLPVRLP